ncbi:uncharacterized protein LOC116770806 isoform X1 [Danaus plexippus]|uniref:uncharacterized protein LOC116770806 isoform X1 n=1 Tax=Danaus plexippus TaxID=13037 RepID=UPI0013C51FE4|nr:uncharacterized protein LOC116770806 isoform X1 [Danaus plexippus]
MFSCIQVETGCLVFAIISLLVTSVGCVASVVLMIYINIISYIYTERMAMNNENVVTFYSNVHIIIFLSVLFGIMAVSLAFSIILTKGLISRKPHLVNAYFIYGVTKSILWVLGVLSTPLIFNTSFWIITFIGCFIYSVVLIMVKKTHVKMSSTKYDEFFDIKQLPEKINA